MPCTFVPGVCIFDFKKAVFHDVAACDSRNVIVLKRDDLNVAFELEHRSQSGRGESARSD